MSEYKKKRFDPLKYEVIKLIMRQQCRALIRGSLRPLMEQDVKTEVEQEQTDDEES